MSIEGRLDRLNYLSSDEWLVVWIREQYYKIVVIRKSRNLLWGGGAKF